MMMNVGLEMSLASMPSPIATPRARTVFPVPSSPERANTSLGRAARPSRSPSRSVCRDEWLTRSSEASGFCRSATRDSASEPAALEEQSDRDPEERAEERCPDREPPFLWDLTEQLQPRAAAERTAERDEAKRADERPAASKRLLVRVERRALFVVGALLSPFGLGRTVLGRIAPVAAPSTPCHAAEATARWSWGRSRSG